MTIEKDPVCGMNVDSKTPKFSTKQKGKLYQEKKKDSHSIFQEESISVHISGMHCASCAIKIETSLRKVEGVKEANVNFASEKAFVRYDAQKANKNDLANAVKLAGYKAIISSEESGEGR